MSEIGINETTISTPALDIIGARSPVMANSISKQKSNKTSKRGEIELCRQKHSAQITEVVAKRLAKIVTDMEMKRLLNVSSEETELADAMTALETFIRNNNI
jgi:hypothetical protein